MANEKIFKNVKSGDTVYIFDRIAVTLNSYRVVSVSDPYKTGAGMVVDVTIGKTTYIFKECSQVGYTPNLIISTDKGIILHEIEEQQIKIAELLRR